MNQQLGVPSQAQLGDFHRKHRVAMVTMLFCDIVGSTKLKTVLGDLGAVETIEKHHEILRSLLAKYPDAEEINSAGDSFFVVFVRPSEAVHFALNLQSRLRRFSREIGHEISNRIGIHVGEIFIQEHKDREHEFFGIQVDTSARIMALGDGDQILLSRFAYDSARQALRQRAIEDVGPLSWMSHGFYELKGVEDPVEVCEVGETGLAILAAPSKSMEGETGKTVSFTTKDGRKYKNVKPMVIDIGLNVVSSDGGALVPFSQLPDDLTFFPDKIRDEISNAKKVQIFKLGKPQRAPVTPGPAITAVETNIINNYPKQEIERRRAPSVHAEAFVPAFSDELPPTRLSGINDLTKTIEFINRRAKSGDRIIYYDTKMQAFVCGEPTFCPLGRVRILYADCRSFNPADLDPGQIEKITDDDGAISIGVYTRNQAKSITRLEMNGATSQTHTFVVPVDDDGDARSVSKAIIHFIQLYAGR